MKSLKTPLGLAVLAYGWWGFVPAYWKQLPDFPSWELIGWRVLFSLLSLFPVLLWRGTFSSTFKLLRSASSLAALTVSTLFIGFNWSLYIWAVTNGHIVESSLGYFLNPLLNMALGTLLLKEKMNPLQKVSFLLAALGVAWLTWSTGRPPWIALLLALSFALYGLTRKLARLPTLQATSVETLYLLPPALLGLAWLHQNTPQGLHAFSASSIEWGWLILSGIVTTVPLLAFAEAALFLPLTVLGFVQFLSPSLQFFLGVFVYHEPFSLARATGFLFIWTGLAFFILDLARRSRIASRANA